MSSGFQTPFENRIIRVMSSVRLVACTHVSRVVGVKPGLLQDS